MNVDNLLNIIRKKKATNYSVWNHLKCNRKQFFCTFLDIFTASLRNSLQITQCWKCFCNMWYNNSCFEVSVEMKAKNCFWYSSQNTFQFATHMDDNGPHSKAKILGFSQTQNECPNEPSLDKTHFSEYEWLW